VTIFVAFVLYTTDAHVKFSDVMLSTIITIYQLLRRMNTQTYCDCSVVILLKSKHYLTAKSKCYFSSYFVLLVHVVIHDFDMSMPTTV